jgi:hypothetical protein
MLNTSMPQTKPAVVIRADVARKILNQMKRTPKPLKKSMDSFVEPAPRGTGRFPTQFDALAAELRTLDFRREQATLKKSMDQALADHLPAEVVARLELLHGNAGAKLAELGA